MRTEYVSVVTSVKAFGLGDSLLDDLTEPTPGYLVDAIALLNWRVFMRHWLRRYGTGYTFTLLPR